MAITEEKRNLVRKRLLDGVSYNEIAAEFGISKNTIIRIKKKMPASALETHDTGDNSIRFDNSTFLTKLEAKFAEKIRKEIWLYEDVEEGWCYHLSKSDCRLKTSGMWWTGIVYPESAPDRWVERLRDQGFRIAISPLHDKDWWDHDSPEVVNPETGEIIPEGARYKKGDRKKAHWHIIVVSDQRMSYQDANNTIRNITHGPYVQKCRSLRNAYDYFLHINAPEKYQHYDKAEIRVFNNFHIEPNKYETGLLQAEMLREIKDHNADEMYLVVDLFIDSPEYLVILAAKPGLFTSFVRSLWKKNHPEGNIQKVQIVNSVKEEK